MARWIRTATNYLVCKMCAQDHRRTCALRICVCTEQRRDVVRDVYSGCSGTIKSRSYTVQLPTTTTTTAIRLAHYDVRVPFGSRMSRAVRRWGDLRAAQFSFIYGYLFSIHYR